MKYIVIGQVKRDGKMLKIGSQVDLDETKGERLVRGGFVVPTKVEVPAAGSNDKGGAK